MHSNNKNQVYYSQMFKGENEINYYSAELPLKTVIQTFDFKNTDEALFICDLTKIKEKYVTWQKYMPRVKPYYGTKVIITLSKNYSSCHFLDKVQNCQR